jgi:hypothetical protein
MIHGRAKFLLDQATNHWERIVWLTSQVECGGRFGTVQSFDGAGMTAGLTQAIAVYPKEIAHEDNNPKDDQGALWKLLDLIKTHHPDLITRIDDEFKELGWTLYKGQVRYVNEDKTPGDLVNGRVIREELTPNQGVVPNYGEAWDSAKSWVLMFHNIFSNEDSFAKQVAFAIEHTQSLAKRKPPFLKGQSIQSILYRDNYQDTKLFSRNDPMDLAAAILFSNAVNAPAMAFRKLQQALEEFGKRPNWQNPGERNEFAKILIRALGEANYARWNFKIVTGRYQRTRKAAMILWPRHLFEGPKAVMPKRL